MDIKIKVGKIHRQWLDDLLKWLEDCPLNLHHVEIEVEGFKDC